MCLILFAYRAHPNYPLIVAANRDEFFNRPTLAADFWHSHPYILGGRDLLAGGTWLGISTQGRFAALTNFRQASDLQGRNAQLRSRGEITSNFLQQHIAPQNFLRQLDTESDQFSGFNTILGDTDRLFYYSNKSKQIVDLSPGIYGLSNGLLNSPWQKVELGKQRLQQLITESSSDNLRSESLLSILTDTSIASDHSLPSTGFPLEKERVLSSAFISSENYGTCCSTALIVDATSRVVFHERNFPKNAEANRHLSGDAVDKKYEFVLQR